MWDVNVQGVVNCIEEFAPDMKKEKKGSIINIGSLYADVAPNKALYDHIGFDKPWSYGATKAAILQVTRHYAARLGKYNIRVNTISPGGVLGEQDPEFIRKYSERVPMGRMAEKEHDLGGPLVFLASTASRYITGINLQINGGYTAL
jgi:NAD(P)-dependent dehydrogenase (short-subunit alcohol dehydrogenase family)